MVSFEEAGERKKRKKKARKKKNKATHLDDPQPVRTQLQNLNLRKPFQPFYLRDLVGGHVQLLQRRSGAGARGLGGEGREGTDLIVRELEAAKRRERREIGDGGQLVVVEDELLDQRSGRRLRDLGGVGEQILAQRELAEVYFCFIFVIGRKRRVRMNEFFF